MGSLLSNFNVSVIKNLFFFPPHLITFITFLKTLPLSFHLNADSHSLAPLYDPPPFCVCCSRSCAVECKCRRDEKPFPSEMTKPPRICLDLLCSPKVALRRVLTRLNLTNCLIHLQPIVVALFRSWEQPPPSPAKTVNACKKSRVARHPEAPLAPPFSLWCTPQTTPYIKSPSYLIWAVALGISANSEGVEL